MLDLKTGDAKIHRLNPKDYQMILDINFTSSKSPDEQDTCHLGCLVAGNNQIKVFQFNFLEHANFQKQQKMQKLLKDQQSLIDQKPHEDHIIDSNEDQRDKKDDENINFMYAPTEHLQFKISRDSKSVIFTDVNEHFIVENHGCFYTQRKLNQLQDLIVMYIEEDDQGTGFFLICSKKYDETITVLHSTQEDFRMSFKKSVEPGIVKIFDMNFYFYEGKEDDSQQANTKTANSLRQKDAKY